jgi:hypothetical protein
MVSNGCRLGAVRLRFFVRNFQELGFGIVFASRSYRPTQEITMKVNPIGAQAIPHSQEKQPPAKAARDLLSTATDLPEQPFGKLVSMFARGEDVPLDGS